MKFTFLPPEYDPDMLYPIKGSILLHPAMILGSPTGGPSLGIRMPRLTCQLKNKTFLPVIFARRPRRRRV